MIGLHGQSLQGLTVTIYTLESHEKQTVLGEFKPQNQRDGFYSLRMEVWAPQQSLVLGLKWGEGGGGKGCSNWLTEVLMYHIK